MVDLPDRVEPRFPPTLEPAARARIERAIARAADINASHTGLAGDASLLGFASAARGGDILFHEACRRQGIDTVIVLPFAREVFINRSVAGLDSGEWPARFKAIWAKTPLERRHVLDRRLDDDDAFSACNIRLLELARQHGQVTLIALWDGREGRIGGTGDLIKHMRNAGRVEIISLNRWVPKSEKEIAS